MKRFQIKDNFSIVTGKHTIKTGGEWLHTDNAQVFRGFFQGRYLFDSVTGFLRYASPAAPGDSDRTRSDARTSPSTSPTSPAPASCPAGTSASGPLLFYLQSSSPDGIARDAAGSSDIANEEFAFFIQDKWQVGHGLTIDYGLRWDAQLMPETVDPATTAFAAFLNDPRFPSDGTIPDQKKQFQPRVGFAWDVNQDTKSVVRGSAGLYYARQNMLSQVGSVTTNGIQQKSDFRSSCGTCDMPVWPNLLPPTASPAGSFPLFTGIRVFDRDYRNPRITSLNLGYEREVLPNLAAYADFTYAKGVHLTRFLNYNVHGTAAAATQPATRDATTYVGSNPFEPQLGDVFVTNSRGRSSYRGLTLGARKRLAQRYQFEANYVLSKDEDDDSNERDPFTERTFNFYDLSLDYGPSDRDIRHRFNFFTYAELPRARADQRPRPGENGAADHDLAPGPERRRPRPQLGSERQQVLLARLATAAHLPDCRALRHHSEHRDVQHVQQRQQHQSAVDRGAVQLRRIPASGRRRSAPAAGGGQDDVLAGRLPGLARLGRLQPETGLTSQSGLRSALERGAAMPGRPTDPASACAFGAARCP